MDALEMSLLYDYYGGLLTGKQRQCFDLRYNQDLSLGEIAQVMGREPPGRERQPGTDRSASPEKRAASAASAGDLRNRKRAADDPGCGGTPEKRTRMKPFQPWQGRSSKLPRTLRSKVWHLKA